jgi:hypothetical protein
LLGFTFDLVQRTGFGLWHDAILWSRTIPSLNLR